MKESIDERLANITLLNKDEQLQLRKDIHRFEPRRLWPWQWVHKCEINVLLVVDGLNFGVSGFGLSNFLAIFQEMELASPSNLKYNVTLADRRDNVSINSQGMQGGNTFIHNRIVKFRFDNTAHFTQNKYDQVWLFGVARPPTPTNTDPNPVDQLALTLTELTAVQNYMNNGGGLFATGDHGNLGLSLCGDIPRVKDMRYWEDTGPTSPVNESEVSMGGYRRNDTNKPSPGQTNTIFDNQCDDLPQTIHARMYNNLPHYLLSISTSIRPSGIIDIMPDHPHEGEIKPETGFTVTNPANGNSQIIRTQNIAVSFVLGGITSGSKDPTTPHCFPSIGVFDGRLANVGRIVVDSTWHHYVNVNFDGFTLSTMQIIKQYFKNISKWISRRKLMLCWYRRLITHAHMSDRIIEASTLNPNSKLEDIPLSELFAIGKHAKDIVEELMTPADAVEFELTHLRMLNPELAAELDPWHPDRSPEADSPYKKWLNYDAITAIAIGTGIVKIRDEFGDINESITPEMEAQIDKTFENGLRLGLEKALESFNETVNSFTDLSNKIVQDNYSIKGKITDAKGNPLSGLRVKAVDQDFSSENQLGSEVLTNKSGSYKIAYKQTDFVINGKESGGADIILYIYDSKGELIHKTDAYPNSPKNTTIDVSIK